MLATAKEELGDVWGINVLFLDRFRHLVAIYGDGFEEYPLFMLDTNSARPVWQANVWGDIPKGLTGSLIQWVSLDCADNMILVVGATGCAAYVEGFSTTDKRLVFPVLDFLLSFNLQTRRWSTSGGRPAAVSPDLSGD